MMFQPRGVEIQEFDFAPSSFAPPAPDVEEGRIRGTGAAAAPGQTYSAVARALEEEKPTVRTRTVDGPDIYLPAPEDRGFDFIEGAYGSYLRPSSELLARADRQRVAREAEEKRLQDIADEVAAEERQFGTAKELAEYETGLRERLAQFEKNLEDDRLDKLREDLRNWELNFLREMDRPPSLDEIRVQAGMYGAQYEIPPEEMARFMGARQTDSDAGGGEGAGAPEAPPAPRTAESILQNIIQSRESSAMESQRIEAARQNAAEQARLLEEALRMSQLQGIPLSASETANLFDEMNAFRREAGLLPLLRMPQ